MKTKLITTFLFVFAFCKNGFSQDTVKYYYPSGQLKLLQVKVDSNTIYEKGFYEEGELMNEGYAKFIDGKYRPLNFKAYYKDGASRVISCDTSYTDYEPNGKVYFHYQTKGGIHNGDSFNYLDGLLIMKGHYKNGQRDGRQISYDTPSGRISSEENYLNGKLDGLIKEYDTLGNISYTILYKSGAVIGATYFDSKGRITKTSDGREEDKNRKQIEKFSKDAFRHQ